MASSWTHDAFRTAEVARLAELDAERIRQMVRDGYCQVARVGRYLHFTFAEVVLFRNIPRLLQADVPARRIRDATARSRRTVAHRSRPFCDQSFCKGWICNGARQR